MKQETGGLGYRKGVGKQERAGGMMKQERGGKGVSRKGQGKV